MAYTPTNTRNTGDLINASIYNNELIGNIDHIMSMLANGTALSALSAGSELRAIAASASGTYTGDGAGSAGSGRQAITGLGFQPDVVIVYDGANTALSQGNQSTNMAVAPNTTSANGLTSYDVDGFTVSDGGSDSRPNKNGEVYHYVALQLS